MTDGPEAILVVRAPDGRRSEVPFSDCVFLGRECRGVDPGHRYLIDEDDVSRTHAEVQVDATEGRAWLLDRSTNGTRLNGGRIERAVPVPIRPGDQIGVGSWLFEFQSNHVGDRGGTDASTRTIQNVQVSELILVVGDILSYSSISEYTPDAVLLENVGRLYSGLRTVLGAHRGTLINYVGDAFFASWEVASMPDAAASAVAFTLEGAALIRDTAPTLFLRDPHGQPLRMGWGVCSGPAAMSSLSGTLLSVMGDATNVAFRLSGLAGRDGRPDILVTDAVRRQISGPDRFSFLPRADLMVKGRNAAVTVHGLAAPGTPVG